MIENLVFSEVNNNNNNNSGHRTTSYVTDIGQHTAHYKINKNVWIKTSKITMI